jgi:hypothetical protein
MSVLLSLRTPSVDGLTSGIRDLVRQASANQGQVVAIPESVAGALNDKLTADSSGELLEVRRRERSVPADVLALHLG